MSMKNGLLLCCGLAISFFSNNDVKAQAVDSSINEAGVKMYKFRQRMPQFRGELGAWIGQQLRYPDSARAQHIEGRVMLAFRINEQGRVDSVQVTGSAHPLLDAEAVRMVRSMPRWIPGRNAADNKRIKTWFTLPVTFELDEAPSHSR
jgi:protein TonB